MEYVSLGRTGTKVSRICLGCMTYGTPAWRPWVLDEAASRPFFQRAWDAGINFFDTADMYSDGVSEEIVGRVLKDFAIPRHQVVIASKVYNPMGSTPNERGLSAKHIRHALDNSLRRLQVDYIDLYQIHRFDYDTPIEETLSALDAAMKAGKVLYIGASSMFAWQLAKMLHTSERLGLARFVTMQNHYNLAYREEEREMNPLCADQGLGLLPWSPLARGFLAGHWKREDHADSSRAKTDNIGRQYYGEPEYAILDRVTEVATRRGVSNAQVALAWLLPVS